MQRHKRVFIEAEANVSKIIKDLIETDWSGSVEEKMKAVSLLKGLATSEDKMAVKFMKDLDAATSKMKPDTYNESLFRGKKSLKENFQLRPFSNLDYREYSGVEVPSNGSPMIGFFDLIIDREYQQTFENLGISFEDFKNTAVIVDAKNIYVIPNTSEDVVFSKKLGFGWNAIPNAISFISKTFRDGITINDLFELDFQSSIDL